MKVIAIIEKGSDGLFSIRTDATIGKVCPGGFGENVNAAKQDFIECVDDALEIQRENEFEKEEIDVEFRYDIPSFFNNFDYFNISKLAQYIGINESQLRQYKNGLSYPNEKTTKRIFKAVHTIGTELYAVSL